MKTLFLVLGVLVAGCASDGAGEGGDTLPKKGDAASDPTIVSATARCMDDGVVIEGQPPPPKTLTIRVAASDPMGEDNLGSVTVAVSGEMDIDQFYEGGATSYHPLDAACTAGTSYVLDITVANKTGGVTTASVDVTAS